MSILGTPDYKKARRLKEEELTSVNLLLNYISVEVEFSFPEGTKYPSIPTRVDDNSDIYPLKGRSVITGPELSLAQNMGCSIKLIEGFIIPFKSVKQGLDGPKGEQVESPKGKQVELNIKKGDLPEKGVFEKPVKQEKGVFKKADVKYDNWSEKVVLEKYQQGLEEPKVKPEYLPGSIGSISIEKPVKQDNSVEREGKKGFDKPKVKEDNFSEQECSVKSAVEKEVLVAVCEDPNVKRSHIKPKEKIDDSFYYGKDLDYETPFRDIMRDLQKKRRDHPKGSFLNQMYKQIGNSVYGQVSSGLSSKKKFDVSTKSFVRMSGGSLSNPILASYITGFTRAVVGECLNNISKLGGKAISVTTDGFIANVPDLENKILSVDNAPCLKLFKDMRKKLTEKILDDGKSTFDNLALEVKSVEEKGVLS